MTNDIFQDLSASEVRVVPHRPDREMVDVDLSTTFGVTLGPLLKRGEPVLDENGKPKHKTKMVKAFKEPGPLTPAINPHYVFPRNELIMFIMALTMRDSIYLQGHSGTGKSELVNQIAARLNYNVVQVNFDGHLLRSDLVGELKIENGSTKFRYGLVPLGFTLPGTILLFDEVDAVAPETAFVLQRAVSRDRKFLMHETSDLFELHPQNIIAATANTTGLGDDSGLYIAGTNVQNFSFQNRWDTVMQIDYLPQEDEEVMLQNMFPQIQADVIRGVASVMANARAGFKNNTLSTPLTTRDAIRWLQKIQLHPAPMRTAEFSFLNRMTVEDAMAVAELISRNFKLPKKDSDKFCKRATKQRV